jgi:hypothetical protein
VVIQHTTHLAVPVFTNLSQWTLSFCRASQVKIVLITKHDFSRVRCALIDWTHWIYSSCIPSDKFKLRHSNYIHFVLTECKRQADWPKLWREIQTRENQLFFLRHLSIPFPTRSCDLTSPWEWVTRLCVTIRCYSKLSSCVEQCSNTQKHVTHSPKTGTQPTVRGPHQLYHYYHRHEHYSTLLIQERALWFAIARAVQTVIENSVLKVESFISWSDTWKDADSENYIFKISTMTVCRDSSDMEVND